MTQERVLEYLIEHGEKIKAEIKIEGIGPKRIAGLLTILKNLEKITKRQVPHGSKMVWCYRATNTKPTEPEHIYILRNLPRNENTTANSY